MLAILLELMTVCENSRGGKRSQEGECRNSKLQARVLRCIRATPRGSKTTQEQKHMFSSNNKNKQGMSKMEEGGELQWSWVGWKKEQILRCIGDSKHMSTSIAEPAKFHARRGRLHASQEGEREGH